VRGCVTTIFVLGLVVSVGAGAWGTARALQDRGTVGTVSTAEDAARAQQKLLRLVRGAARESVVLTEAEVNAFVSRNVDPRDLPFGEPSVFLRAHDVVELVGRVPLGRLLAASPLPLLADLLPSAWLARPIYLRLATHAEFELAPRRQLRLDVRELTVGQQRLPTFTLRLLFEPASLRFVRIVLPETVADVRIESGRAVIQPASSRGRI
jgi:hypothetical protein